MPVTILGIESSCDETGAAVLIDGQIVSNIIANQYIHEKYGGVVPELASRAHLANIVPTVQAALQNAAIDLTSISAIAFTQGPGLLGSLMVGAGYAKGAALTLQVPLIAINHMQAHILAHFIDDPKPAFPFLCLTVSGGHTQIILVQSHTDMRILGQTIDDAAGEAFDKSAKMLGLPYPGGPLIDKLSKTGDPVKFKFSQPKIADLDFSFSGLKTSILYFIQAMVKSDPDFISKNLNDLCASIQHTIVEILLKKMLAASALTGIKEIAIAGGVSANSELRKQFLLMEKRENWKVYIPELQYCTDNAAMIAMAGYYQYLAGNFAGNAVVPLARMPEIC